MNSDPSLQNWPCDWDGHELAQLRRGYQRTFRQNLEWLEAMTDFAKKLQVDLRVKESSRAYGESSATKSAREREK